MAERSAVVTQVESHTETHSDMNSRGWWDQYFDEHWDANDGKNQTRGFMAALLVNVPAPELLYLLNTRTTVLDWGCAKGQGVERIQDAFPLAHAAGLDFSEKALDEARHLYPNLEFLWTEDGSIPREFDVVVTSNCLEHFERPLDIVRAHLPHCRHLYFALVPYNEHPPLLDQHMAQFREESFPEQLAGFTRIAATVIDVDDIYWPGQQLLAVYGSPEYVAQRCCLAVEPPEVTQLRLRLSQDERAHVASVLRSERQELQRRGERERNAQAQIAGLARQIEQARQTADALVSERDALEAERNRLAAERDRLTIERDTLRNVRDQLHSQLSVVYSTKAWRLMTAYWRLREQGMLGMVKLLVLLLASPVLLPLLLLWLIVHGLYHALVPKSLRLAFWEWRWRVRNQGGAVHAPGAHQGREMSWYAFAFDRFKRDRLAFTQQSLADLYCPCEPEMVSVVLPVYNGADMLRESLDSIMAQTYSNFELIAIDDGSTDETGAILDEYAQKDPRIRVIHQENRKLPRTLSRGCRAARGEYITWTSNDNHMKPDFLEHMVGSLRSHPDWDMIYANVDIIGEDGRPLRHSQWYEHYQVPRGSEHVHLPEDPSELNVWPNNYVGAAFLYRNRAAWLLGDYSPVRFTTEDYDYWMRVNDLLTLRHADFAEPVYDYRFHSKSLTARDKELGITSGREKLMVFEDFRRDFSLSRLIWLIEADEGDAAAQRAASALRRHVSAAGQLVYEVGRFDPRTLPRLWTPSVYVRFSSDPGASALPGEGLPPAALCVMVAVGSEALPRTMDSTWEICLSLNGAKCAARLPNDYQGWYATTHLGTLFTAVDVRARSKHLALIEHEILRSKTPECNVSVVICAWQRQEKVLQAVRSVAKQTLPQQEYEVLVVCNDPDDTTLADRLSQVRSEDFADRPERLRYVCCPVPGLSYARNAGIAEARGEVVAFLDDDAIAEENWLEEVWRAFATHPEVGVVGGHIQLVKPDPAPEMLVPGAEKYWSHFVTKHDDYTEVTYWWEFPWGANWSARRQALLDIGGFRTRYGRQGTDFGGGEEVAAAALVKRLNYSIAIAPRARVFHDVEDHRYTWDHIERTLIAGNQVHYRLQEDLYLPMEVDIETTRKQTADPPRDDELGGPAWVQERVHAYRRRAYQQLLRTQELDAAARRCTPVVMTLE